MYKKIDHIGIAVNSLDAVKKFFSEVFGIKPDFEEIIDEQKVKVAGYKIGQSHIEFLEPKDSDSPIAKYLIKKGEGLHHICLNVDNIEKVLSNMKSYGLDLIDNESRRGVKGKKIAFIHPKSFFRVLLELSQDNI